MRIIRVLLARVLGPPLVFLAALLLLLEDVLWVWFGRVTERMATWPVVGAIENGIRRLPPYVTLFMFIVPVAAVQPVKLLGLWMIARGHVLTGTMVLVTAECGGGAVGVRLFTIGRPKLMGIAWFAAVVRGVMRGKSMLYEKVASYPLWKMAEHRVEQLKARARRAAAARRTSGPIASQYGRLRRWTGRSDPGPA